MSYLDPETDTYVGFDAELAEDLADALGVEIEYVKTSWPISLESINRPEVRVMENPGGLNEKFA